jgi:hypothetical protein
MIITNTFITLITGLGALLFLLFLFIIVAFKKIIFNQLKLWKLARKGYNLIEFIHKNNVRTYYFLQPDNKEHFIEESALVAEPSDKSRLIHSGNILFRLATGREREEIMKLVYNNNYRSMLHGVPALSYVEGNNNPFPFTIPNKKYDSVALKNLHTALTLELCDDQLKKILLIGIILIGIIALGTIMLGIAYNNNLGLTEKICNIAELVRDSLNVCVQKAINTSSVVVV